MPHSPYFGPGYWATLQLLALLPDPSLFEFLYVTTDAWIDPGISVACRREGFHSAHGRHRILAGCKTDRAISVQLTISPSGSAGWL